MIRGVIFDMDGVITDNNPFHEKAWADFCRNYEVSLSDEEVHQYIFGRIARDTLEYIFKRQLTVEEVNEFVDQKEKIYREIYEPYIEPLKGLIPLLESLKMNKIKLGLATSAPPGNVKFTFDHIPVKHYFDVILDADSIKKGKPDPEIYIKAIHLLGLTPGDCIIFEDSIPGITAALASGAFVIGLATTHQPEALKGVKGILKDFTGINIDNLRNI